MKLCIFLILILLSSCGKDAHTVSTTLLIRGANTNNIYSNGIVINAHKANSNEFFSLALNSNNSEVSKQISKGTWTFAIIGWLPNGSNEKLEGIPKCASLTKDLVLNDEVLNFSLSEFNCTKDIFNNNSQNFDSSGLIKKITFVPCKTLQDGLIQSNGNCDFKREYIGTSLSYRIVFHNTDQNSSPTPSLFSKCFKAADLTSSIIATGIRLPVGGTEKTFPVVIQGFEKENCTTPDAKYFFSKGLGNSGISHTVDTINEYTYTTDDIKLYFSDNYLGVGTTPFLNQAVKLDCNSVHCFNTPTVRSKFYNSFDHISRLAKSIFGTKDGVSEDQLERLPYINLSDVSGNGLTIELATYASDHGSYTVNFLTGTAGATYNSGTKILDITLNSTTETIDNIATLLSGVSEFNATKFGITTNSISIGTEIPATSTLLEGEPAEVQKHRDFGVLDQVNFLMLGPFGGLISRNGYTKCDNSLDPNDVYSAIGSTFTRSFNNESVRVDIATGSVNLTSVGGPSASGLRLTYWHKGKIIGIHELNCDGVYDKAGWIRLTEDSNSQNVHEIEFYYNEGDDTNSKFEMYVKSTDCNSSCLHKSIIRIYKESIDSFKIWVTSSSRDSSSNENYVRFSGAFDASIDQFDIKTYSDGVSSNVEPDSLAEYDTEVTPLTNCLDILGQFTSCSYNPTDPASDPILLTTWSTSETYLNDSTFENFLFSIP